METLGKKLRPEEMRDARSPEIPGGRGPALEPVGPAAHAANLPGREFDMWKDVFVQQALPWPHFLQSGLLHGMAVYLICTVSLSWMQEQKVLTRPAFDRSSLVTYTPDEYLPPLDTGKPEDPPEAAKTQKGDPVFARQPILSVPPEADNHSQTIVVPPDLKLDHDVPLPNIVATGAIAPAIPLDAAPAGLSRTDAAVPEPQVVAPAPDVASAPNRGVQTAMKSDVIAPPPEVTHSEVTHATHGLVGPLNIGPSDVVAPTPQLTLAEQHSLAARGGGRVTGGGIQPVAPPPSVAAGNGSSAGRLIALGIHPVVPSGPVPVPAGNRRGEFAATPRGKSGASGTPDLVGTKSDAGTKSAGGRGNGSGGFGARNGSLPAGLHVGAVDSADGAREVAGLSSTGPATGERSNPRAASPIADDKMTELDRKVFGGKRVYGRTLNMPNLNSSTGSWVIKFAELGGERKEGELLEPVATEKSDPGYPLELIRNNVHGMVTLYAVIDSDGKVGGIKVLNSPDERLDSYATKALSGWKFVPAERAGKPVALEAVVMIPFRVRRSF
jgi:TonB family protein